MTERTGIQPLFDPPNSRKLRLSFHLLWIVDMCTAMLLILVPYAQEVNPMTLFLYDLFGIVGVGLAAGLYAAVVVSIGHYLSHPVDLLFLVVIVALYVFFVFNNVLVLLFDEAVIALVVSDGRPYGSQNIVC